MAVPAPINRLPTGLLSFLGTKAMGVNPGSLAGELVPVMDLTKWYVTSTFENVATNANTITTGDSFPTGVVVPAGEVWYVDSFTVRVANAGASSASGVQAFVRIIAGGTYIRGYISEQSAALVAATDVVLLRIPGPFFMLPGEQPAISCSVAAGTPTAQAQLRITRFLT